MEKWSHKSLGWIHRVREQNYEATIEKNAGEMAQDTLQKVQDLIKTLNLRVIHPVSSPK